MMPSLVLIYELLAIYIWLCYLSGLLNLDLISSKYISDFSILIELSSNALNLFFFLG